ncbi:hypothetical protein D3C84_1230760 [compost metagenome]
MLIEIQRIDNALIAFPSMLHILGVQIAEPHGFGDRMDVQGSTRILQPVVRPVALVNDLIP